MAVTAAATAVIMALLHSPVGGCTRRTMAVICIRNSSNFNSFTSTRASTCSWLLPTAGTAAAQRTMAVAAAAEPGSRRRRSKASIAQHQEQQQQPQQASQAAPGQTQAGAASKQQDEQSQEQQQQQQQQQQRSRQLLWDTAAQLGLRRGSQIAPPPAAAATATAQLSDTAGASSAGYDFAGSSSSSRAAAFNRRRRSRASSSSSDNNSSSSDTLEADAAVSRFASSSASSSIQADNSESIDQDKDSAADSAIDSSSFSSRDDAVAAAIARLGRFLDFRERCASEVLAKLAALGYDGPLAQRALQELQTAGLQSDARFAEMFVRGSWRTKAQSPARLAYELRSRSVPQQHIDAAMVAVFGPGRQLPGREAASDQEEEMWEHLVEVCKQRAELTRTEPKQKRRAKLAGWLQRRGHNMSTIFRIFEAVGI